jgi:hypothetical protein
MVHFIKTKSPQMSKDMIDKLAFFEYNIDGEEFKRLYVKAGGTPHMADHLWGKFDSHNHSILHVFGYADLENKRLLTKVVNEWMWTKK